MNPSHSAIEDIARQLFSAIERGDRDGLTVLWSDDVVVWRQGGGRERDKARALKVIEWFIGATVERRYEVLDREVFDTGFVQQHVLHAITGGGQAIAMRVCMVVKIGADGRINRIDEYLDPADLTPLSD